MSTVAYEDERAAFEVGYVDGLAVRRAQNEHAHAATAFRAGVMVGRRSYEVEIDHASHRAHVDNGRALGVQHADHDLIPAGLDSDEAAVWLAIALGRDVERAALQAAVRDVKPSLSIGQVDALRKDLQARGLVSSSRDGHRTLYAAVIA
jgi:hypothetical protein